MTGHYARLHDATVRRHWEAARKVGITGQAVILDPDGPLAEAAWAKQRLGTCHPGSAQRVLRPASAKDLPACQHLPACQRVPDLPDVHHNPGVPAPAPRSPAADHPDHLCGSRGQTRPTETNQQILANLDNIITGL